MKKVFKILAILCTILLVFIVLLSVIAKLKENKITEIALSKIEETIKVPITIEDISFTLIRRFPLATIKLDHVWIGYPKPGTDTDTLAYLEKVFVSVKSRPLLNGEVEIMQVEINGVDFSYLINQKGQSNLDFLKDTTDQKQQKDKSNDLSLILKELQLEHVRCQYLDSLNQIAARLEITEADINGRLKDNYLIGSVAGELILTNCGYKATNLRLMEKTGINFDLDYNNDTVNINDLRISTDGAEFSIKGNTVIRDTISMDIQYAGKEIIISELLKYVPKNTLKKTGILTASGKLEMKGTVKGNIADSLLPGVVAGISLLDGKIEHKDYPTLRNISFIGEFSNGKKRTTETMSILVNDLRAETAHSGFRLKGSINNLDRIKYSVKSDMQIELSDFKRFIPDTILNEVTGRIGVKLSSKGNVPDSIHTGFVDDLLKTSTLELAFEDLYIKPDSGMTVDSLSGRLVYDLYHITGRNIGLKVPSQSLSLTNSSFDARFSGNLGDLSGMNIEIKSYQIHANQGTIFGDIQIQNLKRPEYSVNSTLKLNLGKLIPMLPDSLITKLSGEVLARISSKGSINTDSVANQVNKLVFENSTFNIEMDRVSFAMPDTLIEVDNLSGNLGLHSDTLTVRNTQGIYKGIEFRFDSTIIVNIYNSLIKKHPVQLSVDTRIKLGNLDYSLFAPLLEQEKDTIMAQPVDDGVNSPEIQKDSISFNPDFLIKGKLNIRSFTYKQARLDNISALYKLTDSLYLVDKFRFDAFGGKHSTSVKYEIKKDSVSELWVNNTVRQMDVNKLLLDFNDFSDYYEPAISHNNITGVLSARLDGQILFTGNSVQKDKIRARANIKLENGGIYNYIPVMNSAPNLPGISDLSVMKFDTINTDIFVYKEAFYVPNTIITSNIFDASAFGKKGFGEDYQYHFMVFLSDILTKNKSTARKLDEKGILIDESGRKGRMIKVYSEKGKNRNGIDNKDSRLKMQQAIRLSEGQLKLRFFPDMVNYNTGVE